MPALRPGLVQEFSLSTVEPELRTRNLRNLLAESNNIASSRFASVVKSLITTLGYLRILDPASGDVLWIVKRSVRMMRMGNVADTLVSDLKSDCCRNRNVHASRTFRTLPGFRPRKNA
jgi:hypothetical protein